MMPRNLRRRRSNRELSAVSALLLLLLLAGPWLAHQLPAPPWTALHLSTALK